MDTGEVVSTSHTQYVFANKKHKRLQMSPKENQSMETLLVRLLQVGWPKLDPNLCRSQFRSLHKADLRSKPWRMLAARPDSPRGRRFPSIWKATVKTWYLLQKGLWKTKKSSLHCFHFTERAKFPSTGNFTAERRYHVALKRLKNKWEDLSLFFPCLFLEGGDLILMCFWGAGERGE